jgi:hypothetical protein
MSRPGASLVLLALSLLVVRGGQAQPPAVTGVSPVTGNVGATVFVNGSGFSTTPANNAVTFGASSAAVVAATATTLTVQVPAGATYAPVRVSVGGLSGDSPLPFIPTFASGSVDSNSFALPVSYPSGASPYRVMLIDLNADGKPDILAPCYAGNSLTALRNIALPGAALGATSFSQDADVGAGTRPVSVATGDLDGDGKPDVVVGNQFVNYCAVFLNQSTFGGSVGFGPRTDVVVAAGFKSVAIADLDLDGKLDLIVARRDQNLITLYRNTSVPGTVSFAAGVDLSAPDEPVAPLARDIDGDRRPEIIVAREAGSAVSVRRNLSVPGSLTAGSFGPEQVFAAGASPVALDAGDLDGDARLDIVIGNQNSLNPTGLRNTSSIGAISFATFSMPPAPDGQSWIAVADFNGDGLADVGCVNKSSGAVSAYRNTSSGAGSVAFASRVDYAVPAVAYGLAFGDLNADGKPEVVTPGFGTSGVTIRENSVLPPPRLELSRYSILFPDVALGDSTSAFLFVKNSSPSPLTITSVTTTAPPFTTTLAAPIVIGPNDSVLTFVKFKPVLFGTFAGLFRVQSDGGDTSATLLGTSPFPTLMAVPESLAFAPLPQYESALDTIAITNTSLNTLIISQITTSTPSFRALVTSGSVGTGQTLLIPVEFNPRVVGVILDSLEVTSNAQTGVRRFPLSGTGLAVTNTVVEAGWSLASIPRVVASYAPDDVFPGRVGTVFGYDNPTQSYTFPPVLANGEGYWVKFAVRDTISFVGAEVTTVNVSVTVPGWVLLGSITKPIAVSSIQTTPGGVIVGQVFGYDRVTQGYVVAGTVAPAFGYWVKVSQPCTIRLQ